MSERERGPFDHEFELSHVPTDEPPGLMERQYAAWKARGGQVLGPAEQPPPVPNGSAPIWELVVKDMQARDRVGRQRYGTPLQAHNGRDALLDAYEEALDLCVYLRQVLAERDQNADANRY